MQYEEGHYPLDEMRQAATYLLVNQILFYHILSTASKEFLPIEEDKIGKPMDLLRYFDPVLKIDYTSVFGFDVASKLPESATAVVKRVIVVVKALAPEKIGHDILGKVFHDLIPFNIRKAVAAFYTNNEAAEILADLSIDKSDAKVIDLACGSGTLLVAAYHRKKELLNLTTEKISKEDHKQFLENDITGVDIMPFAAHLAVMHLSLQALLQETDRVRIAVWDSTELKPDMKIPAIYSELKAAYKKPTLDMFKEESFVIPKDALIKKGAITLEGVGGTEIPLEKVDLVIMNPPFTRQERLPKEYKEALSKRLKEYKTQINGQLGLWGYFLLLADRFVKPGGRIALVFPTRPLGAKSSKEIRKFLLANYSFEYLISSWEKLAFSESTLLREMLLIIRKNQSTKEIRPDCKIINVKSMPSTLAEAHSLADEIKTAKEEYESNRIKATTITQNDLAKTIDNWFTHIASFDPMVSKQWVKILSQSNEKLILFKNYLDKKKIEVIRGVETTGRFDFQFYETFIVREVSRAMKSHDLWFAEKVSPKKVLARNRFTNEIVEVPMKALCNGIRRASGMSSIDLTENEDFLVIKPFEGLEKLVSFACAKEIQKHSDSWSHYVENRFGIFLISRRFNLSAVRTHLLAFYSKKPTTGQNLWSLKGISEEDAKMLSLWFNSTLNLLQVYLQRMETGGTWMEINSGMLNDFFVLNFDSLKIQEREALLELFEKVKNTKFPSIIDQLRSKFSQRREIDQKFMKILGFSEDEINQFLEFLYPTFTKEIEKLMTIMEK